MLYIKFTDNRKDNECNFFDNIQQYFELNNISRDILFYDFLEFLNHISL